MSITRSERSGKRTCYFKFLLLSFLFPLFSRSTLSRWLRRKEQQLTMFNIALVLHPLPCTLVVEIQVMITTALTWERLVTELFFDNSLWHSGEWIYGSNEPTCLWCSTRRWGWRCLWSLFPSDRHRWPILDILYWSFLQHCGQGDKSLVNILHAIASDKDIELIKWTTYVHWSPVQGNEVCIS